MERRMITKDQTAALDEDPEKTPEDIRLAQKATGELMWLGTKSRPDLIYTLSRMAQALLRSKGSDSRGAAGSEVSEEDWWRRALVSTRRRDGGHPRK